MESAGSWIRACGLTARYGEIEVAEVAEAACWRESQRRVFKPCRDEKTSRAAANAFAMGVKAAKRCSEEWSE
jgi:arginyl-tRNA--protein-N-Asp/Glu arginylyltransferase